MSDSHEIPPNVRSIKPLAFKPSNYLPPASTASPLTFFDAHEMADVIQRTMARTDVAIADDIAAHMETKNMSGRDFLNLIPTDLRILSKNNEQAFQELRRLQQIPHGAMTSLSTRSPSIAKRFPELAPLIHSSLLSSGPDGGVNSTSIGNGSGSSTMLGPQFLEESFTLEAFDYSDDEDEVPPDLHSTVPIANEDSVLASPDIVHYHSLPDTRNTSPALSYVNEEYLDAAAQLLKIPFDDGMPNPSTPADPNILLGEDRLPTISRHFSPTKELPSQSGSDSLEGSQLENLFTFSLDHPQSLPSSLTSFREPTTDLSLTTPHSVDTDIQSVATSTDENLEDPFVYVSSNMSPLAHHSNLPRLDLNERSNVDMDIPASATTLPFNTLPFIPVTPSSSPVFEGLAKYMTLQDSDAPRVVSQENFGVNPDKVSTPVQCEMPARECPSSAVPPIELLSFTSGNGQSLRSGCSQAASNSSGPSGESKETSGSDVDIKATQPDLCCLHLFHLDSYPGMSNRGLSTYQRMQLGVFVLFLFFISFYFLVYYSPLWRATPY